MSRTHFPLLFLALLGCSTASVQAQVTSAADDQDKQKTAPADPNEPRWIPLFNGEDLTGWTPKIKGYEPGEDPLDTFRVSDGLLEVNYEKYESFDGRFGHLFHEKSWSHYRLRVEYRFIGEQVPGGPGWAFRNSGAMLHGQPVGTMGKDQDFPVSIEAQFLGGRAQGERPTANLCTPGTHVEIDGKLVTRHCTNSTSKTVRGDDWVVTEFEVRGSEVIRHFVDGELVLEYQAPQLDPNDGDAKKLLGPDGPLIHEGSISLQSESHPIQFRKVEILPLDG